MKAFLVYDGGDKVHVPPVMGKPLETQLTGTIGEQLTEVSTRICYDSLGADGEGKPKGRATKKTLKNIMAVNHGSVLEHFNRTLHLDINPQAHSHFSLVAFAFLNRPGCFTRMVNNGLRVTMNIRAIWEWDSWTDRLLTEHNSSSLFASTVWHGIGSVLRNAWANEVPILISPEDKAMVGPAWLASMPVGVVEPESDSERWVSMYLAGSRGFSHEQVRHRFAISQRSTRYVDEDGSPWHWHPLLNKYLRDVPDDQELIAICEGAQGEARHAYKAVVSTLEKWLLSKLPEDIPYRKKHARKQARGAARGFLGNAVHTEMIYSAPVWAWRHMMNMRGADAADAEIRIIFAGDDGQGVAVDRDSVFGQLAESRYSDRFDALSVERASDGIGFALAGGGHA